MLKSRFISLLVLLAAVVTGAWAQTYTVTFSGADFGSLNEAFNNVTMPYSFSAVNELNLSPWKVIVGEGSSYTNVYVSSGGEGKVSVSYNSINMTITISGAFEGTATIHCEGLDDDGSEISRDVYVTCVENKVNVTGVTLSQTAASMTVGGDALTLTATVAPDDAPDKTVTWTTSDASVATVADGVVTAVGAGTATITATATNGTTDTSDDKTATCEVTVSPAGYSVALKEGTEDAENWSATPSRAAEGQTVTLKYTGRKKIKRITIEAATTDLSTLTADYEAKDGETLTGTLANNVKISIADGATVTLKDVNINGVNNFSYNYAGITCAGDATITLEGTNTVKGFHYKNPGIFVSPGKTLVINGTGELNARSNGFGAGIGGGFDIACGNIVINSGNITATGGQSAAGIGGGSHNGLSGNGSCGDITINGGTITATGGQNAAGIGGGFDPCGNITISGGTITATGGKSGAGIGGGSNRTCGNITISGGTVEATGGDYAAGIGGGRFNPGCGNITITSGVTSVTATKGNDPDNIGSYAESIGCGDNGSGITVTIGGNVGAITTSPYTYAPAAPTARTAAEATAEDIGKLIGADGNIYDDAAAATAASTTAVAVIAYVGSDTYDATFKNGLAIALADEGEKDWSTAMITCVGKTAITGAKWCMPSQDQWKQMFKANGGNEVNYTGLNTTITTAGGTTLLEDDVTYWSSSEYAPGVGAYIVYLAGGSVEWIEGNEGENSKFRACLAF